MATLIHDAKRHEVEVRLPCLSAGTAECTLEERDEEPEAPALRLAWSLVRGIGNEALERLTVAKRTSFFRSIEDIVSRAALTRNEATALARGQAFARWEPDRRRAERKALRAVGDTLPLGPSPRPSEDSRPADGYQAPTLGEHERIVSDYHTLGLSIAGHPMAAYRAWCRRVGVKDSRELQDLPNGSSVLVAGLMTVRQRPATAKGTHFLLLEDEHGQINLVCFKTLVEKNA